MLGAMRFLRARTAINFLSCVTIIGDPNNEHRNDHLLDNVLAFATLVIVLLLTWLLFDDQFTFGNGYITGHFGLVIPDDAGIHNLGFSVANALGLVSGICFGEAVRNTVHLFEPEDEESANFRRNKTTRTTLDAHTQVAAELCAYLYDLNSRTGRIALAAFSAVYRLREDQKADVLSIFDAPTRRTKKISSMIKPVRDSLKNDPRVGISFFEQIVKIGLASGHASARYIDRLKTLANALGIDGDRSTNILEANGFKKNAQHQSWSQTNARQESSGYQHQTFATGAMSETEKHLAKLGLKKGASQKEIKSAYRKMAKKYHPDILKSKSLTEAQMAAATQAMREINAAYEWLEN